MTRHAAIIGIGSYLPERRLTNFDLESMVDTSDEWIVSRTGISRGGLEYSQIDVSAGRKLSGENRGENCATGDAYYFFCGGFLRRSTRRRAVLSSSPGVVFLGSS